MVDAVPRLASEREYLPVLGAHVLFVSYMIALCANGLFKDWQELVTEPFFLLRGLKNYTDIATHHAPLLTEFLAVVYNLFGTGVTARLVLLVIAASATAFLTFRASCRLADKRAGVYSVLLLAIFWPFYGGMNFWFDTFLPVFYLTAFLLITGKGTPSRFLLAGVSMGLSFLVKQHGGVVALAVALMLLLRRVDLKERLKECWWFSCGVWIPIVVVAVWYALNGQIGDAYYWMIEYNVSGQYGRLGMKPPPVTDVIRLLYVITPIVLVLGAAARSENGREHISWDFLLVLVMGFCASLTILPRWERWHVAPSVPFLVIGLVIACKSIIEAGTGPAPAGSRRIMKKIVIAWILAVLIDVGTFHPPMLVDRFVPGFLRHWPLRSYEPPEWFDEDFRRLMVDVPAVGKYLREVTSEDERILVWGWMGSRLYFESGRLPAGRFYYTLPWFTYLPRFREDLLMAFERGDPRFVVDLKIHYPGTPSLRDMGIDLEERGFARLEEMSGEFPQFIIWKGPGAGAAELSR
jgi:hypothetical protein